MASGQPLEPQMQALSLSAGAEQPQEAVDRLTILPNDIIDLIFSKLPPGSSRALLHCSKAFTLKIEDDDVKAVLGFPRPIKRLVLDCLDVESYVPNSFECLGRGSQGRLQAVEELCFQNWKLDDDDCPTPDLARMAKLIQTYCPNLRRLELDACDIEINLGELLKHFSSPSNAAPLRKVRIACCVANLYVNSLLKGLALLGESLKVLSLYCMVEPEQSEYDEDHYFADPADLQPLVGKLCELEFLSIEIGGTSVQQLVEFVRSCRKLHVRRTKVRVYRKPAPPLRRTLLDFLPD